MVSVSLFATFSHKTWIANDFSLFQFFQKRSKISNCNFWKFFTHESFSFLFIFCTRNRHLTMIESYIKRNDVIKCELNLVYIEKTDSLFHFHTWLSRDADRFLYIAVAREKNVDRLSQIAVAKTLCWEISYSISRTTRNWINLFLINDFVKSLIII